jgi:hypothetical protein
LGKRANAWVPEEGIKAQKPSYAVSDSIVLGDEYPVMGYLTPATANETRSLHAHRKVSVRYFTVAAYSGTGFPSLFHNKDD